MKCRIIILIAAIFLSVNIHAGNVKVSSIPELISAIASASPGDNIVVINGVYTTESNVIISCSGTPEFPILITAGGIGDVEINGKGGFVLDSTAAYVVIKGFKFTHATGKSKINVGAVHCTITNNIFECAPDGTGNKPYLNVSGDDNEICYNTFQNKDTEGCMITVQGPGSSGMAQRNWIHHNYFYNFINKGFNNCSAIQVGLSGRSLSAAYTIVEYNLFIKTSGENEGCICNKSCNNIYRYNSFGEGSTELSLRHGNQCEVYNNYFIKCSGLRFCGHDHKIYNNYFEGCNYAINCVNGDGIVPKDKLTSHDRPGGVRIMFNTLVNNRMNYGMPKRNNGLGATDIVFANNIIQGGAPISIADLYVNPKWEGNIIWNIAEGENQIPETGYKKINPLLVKDEKNIYRITQSSSLINNSEGLYPEVKFDIDGQIRNSKPHVGADEYSNDSITNLPLTPNDVGAFTEIRVTK